MGGTIYCHNKEINMEAREEIKLINIALSGTLDLYRIWAKKHQLNYNALVILYTLDDYKTCTQKQIYDWWALPLPKIVYCGLMMKNW